MKFSVIFIVLLQLCSFGTTLASNQEKINPQRMSPIVMAVNRVSSAVVNISTEKVVAVRDFNPFSNDRLFEYFSPFRERNVTRQSLGSGVIIGPEGTVLTNEHIILPASAITVTRSDGKQYEAELIGASRRFDVALLQIKADEPLPFLAPAKSDDLMIGETVIAIGNPFGLSSTVTTGVVSALNRTLKFQDSSTKIVHTYHGFIQTDASINPGNSGGPLLNILGELIGINTAIYENAEGIGFAIPIDKAKRVLDDLMETGEVPQVWLGIQVQALTPLLATHLNLSKTEGILISDVMKDSPGSKAGLNPGDVILAVEGQSVLMPSDYRDLLREFTPGDSIPIEILHQSEIKNIEVTAMQLPKMRAEELIWNVMGLKLKQLTRQSSKKFGLRVNSGALVEDVRPESPASSVGIRPGDAIVQLDRSRINSIEEFYSIGSQIIHHDSITLVVIRRAAAYHVTLTLY